MKNSAAFLYALVLTGTAAAQEPIAEDIDPEQVDVPENNAIVSGILIGTYQATSKDRIGGQPVEDEGNAQLYLFGEWDMGPGTWGIEVRGGTTPDDNGVTSFLGEVNDSVGETLNSDGEGRIAATQLFYALAVGRGDLILGLLDATSLLDANDIADDEYTQFLGTSFVNNPSIEYPSFALGASYQINFNEQLGYQVFVSSSGGLEDEDDPTYGNVFEVGEDGRGVFVGNELHWATNNLSGAIGIWYNGSDHTELANETRTNEDNYGAYTSLGGGLGQGQWVAWGGIANDDVFAAANFLALAVSYPIGGLTLGAGLSRIGVSDDLPEPATSIKQAELYLRIPVTSNFYVTPDLHYIDNSGFDPALDDVLVAGVRAGIEF